MLSCDSGRLTAHPDLGVDVGAVDRVGLRVTFDGPVLRFAWGLDDTWHDLPAEFDATVLSDEHAAVVIDGEPAAWGFTGAFLGLWVQDLGADGVHADYDYATYLEY